MNTFMNFFKNLLIGKSDIFSRQDLSDCIFSVFEKSLMQQTTREGLLFDTNYIIYLPEAIYNSQQDSFAHTSREVVNRCHNVLRKIASKYPTYKPHSRCWKFRFIKVTEDMDLGKNNEKLKDENIVIISSLHVEKRKAPLNKKNNASCIRTVLTTRKNVEDRKIDYIDLDGLTVLDKDSFEIKLDKFDTVDEMPASDLERTETDYIAHAIIKLKYGNFTDDSEYFYMTKESLYIVGMKYDSSNLTSKNEVAVIENENLSEDFFINIEALKDTQFMIRGNEDVLLNEDIHLSPDKPQPIQDGSSIMLNNEIQIIFSIIK